MRFEAAHTQVLGVSIDSVHSHANWAQSLGGISFPLLSDFEPKGAIAHAFGLYLEDAGMTDRGTVLVDSGGIIQHVSSSTPAGHRDIDELATLCEKNDVGSGCATTPFKGVRGVVSSTTLFVKSHCGFSRAATLAVENLHLVSSIQIRNVTEDDQARRDFEAASGRTTAPCLVMDGDLLFESVDIVKRLASIGTEL